MKQRAHPSQPPPPVAEQRVPSANARGEPGRRGRKARPAPEPLELGAKIRVKRTRLRRADTGVITKICSHGEPAAAHHIEYRSDWNGGLYTCPASLVSLLKPARSAGSRAGSRLAS